MANGPIVLCILDGVGWGRRDDGDAVFAASTPNLDSLMDRCPWTLLAAHGTAVGMPSDDDMGNSEVGHNSMGAGRVFDQGAKLVANAIDTGHAWSSSAWKNAIQGNTLHLIGLLSDGNVHSHVDHLHSMIDRAIVDGVKRLRVHILTDGRDVAARSALRWVEPLEAKLAACAGDYAVGSGGGRMYITMDRYDADWPMVQRGWETHVMAQGRRFDTATQAIQTLYSEHPSTDDQHLPAFVINGHDGMKDGDAAILFNFRGDRALEICQAFDKETLTQFPRGPKPNIFFAGMMQYDGDLQIPKNYLVEPPTITNTVAEYLEVANKCTFAVSETQKFGHVTYFFNGNRGECPPAEAWKEIPSLNVPFDEAPHMCAAPVTEVVCEAIRSGQFDHIRVNLANGDMVGHTGNMSATIEAVEYVDHCLGQMMKAVKDAGGRLIVTADHGNADQMYAIDKKTGTYATDEHGNHKSHTSHSLHPVPFIVYDPTGRTELTVPSGPSVQGKIAQIGASLLMLCGVPVPSDYLPSLIRS